MALTSAQKPSESEPFWIEFDSIRIVLNSVNTNDKISEDLDVSVMDVEGGQKQEVKASNYVQKGESSHTWKLKDSCVAFSKDEICVTPFFVRRRLETRKEVDRFTFDGAKVMGTQQSGNSQDCTIEYEMKNKNSTLHLTATIRGLSSILISNSSSFDDSTLGKHLDDFKLSSLVPRDRSAFKGAINTLKGDVHIKILETVANTLTAFASAHPILKIIATALRIPYDVRFFV